MHAHEVFLAAQLQPDRAPRLFGQLRRHQIRILALVLVAKTPTHVLADHTHLFQSQVQISGNIPVTVGNPLGGGPHRQLISFPVGQGHARLHLGIVHVLGDITIFKDKI